MIKKAQSHVEVIISFILFISVVLFILFYINPIAKTSNKVSEIEDIEERIIENISLNVEKVSIVSGGGCYNYTPSESYYTEVEKKNKYYYIYLSNENIFDNDLGHNGSCNHNFSLGVYVNESFVIESRLEKLIDDYTSNYEGLKESFDVNQDFMFGLLYMNETETGLGVNKTIPQNIEIESKQKLVKVINESGYVNNRILNVRAW